jgi:hypothetical protein
MTNKNTGNITAESDKVPIEVAGTPGRIAKFATATTLTDSIITESAGRIGVGTATSNAILTVTSAAAASPAISARNTATGGVGVSSDSPSGNAVLGVSQSGNGVFGKSPGGLGVAGQSTSGVGVLGTSDSGVGVHGKSTSSAAVLGENNSNQFAAVAGINQGIGFGVYGESTGGGFAGYFAGKVHVFGTLSKGGGGFTIDHPLDPTNKTLTHSFVESPDMMNIYNGNTITDAQGNATITLPAYFQALNGEFRYQLTVMEQFAQAIALGRSRRMLSRSRPTSPM